MPIPSHDDIINFFRPLPKHEEIVAKTNPEEEMYKSASASALKNYGVKVSPEYLKAVRFQESSNKVNEKNYALSMGITPTVEKSIGKNFKTNDSLANAIENSANYLALRSKHKRTTGEEIDMSTPENQIKWYVQKYVGLLPGESRKIGGQTVTYEDIYKSFENNLKNYSPKDLTMI